MQRGASYTSAASRRTWCVAALARCWRQVAEADCRPPPPLLQKPQKLRHMLEQYGELGRLYLAPEGGWVALGALHACQARPTGRLALGRAHRGAGSARSQASREAPAPPPAHPLGATAPTPVQTPCCGASASSRAATRARTSQRAGWSLRVRLRSGALAALEYCAAVARSRAALPRHPCRQAQGQGGGGPAEWAAHGGPPPQRLLLRPLVHEVPAGVQVGPPDR